MKYNFVNEWLNIIFLSQIETKLWKEEQDIKYLLRKQEINNEMWRRNILITNLIMSNRYKYNISL